MGEDPQFWRDWRSLKGWGTLASCPHVSSSLEAQFCAVVQLEGPRLVTQFA